MMPFVRPIERCEQLAALLAKNFHNAAGTMDSLPVNTLRGLHNLALEYVVCIHLLAKHGGVTPAMGLTRTVYESGVNALWAAREPDGWERLEKYWLAEDAKWLSAMPSTFPQTQVKLKRTVAELAAMASVSQAPPLRQRLEQIEQREIALGKDVDAGTGLRHYNTIYLPHSAFAHGNAKGLAPAAHPGALLAIAGAIYFALDALRIADGIVLPALETKKADAVDRAGIAILEAIATVPHPTPY